MIYLPIYMYHKNQPNVGINIPYMDPIGFRKSGATVWGSFLSWLIGEVEVVFGGFVSY